LGGASPVVRRARATASADPIGRTTGPPHACLLGRTASNRVSRARPAVPAGTYPGDALLPANAAGLAAGPLEGAAGLRDARLVFVAAASPDADPLAGAGHAYTADARLDAAAVAAHIATGTARSGDARFVRATAPVVDSARRAPARARADPVDTARVARAAIVRASVLGRTAGITDAPLREGVAARQAVGSARLLSRAGARPVDASPGRGAATVAAHVLRRAAGPVGEADLATAKPGRAADAAVTRLASCTAPVAACRPVEGATAVSSAEPSPQERAAPVATRHIEIWTHARPEPKITNEPLRTAAVTAHVVPAAAAVRGAFLDSLETALVAAGERADAGHVLRITLEWNETAPIAARPRGVTALSAYAQNLGLKLTAQVAADPVGGAALGKESAETRPSFITASEPANPLRGACCAALGCAEPVALAALLAAGAVIAAADSTGARPSLIAALVAAGALRRAWWTGAAVGRAHLPERTAHVIAGEGTGAAIASGPCADADKTFKAAPQRPAGALARAGAAALRGANLPRCAALVAASPEKVAASTCDANIRERAALVAAR
jgi:hypothetical protein